MKMTYRYAEGKMHILKDHAANINDYQNSKFDVIDVTIIRTEKIENKLIILPKNGDFDTINLKHDTDEFMLMDVEQGITLQLFQSDDRILLIGSQRNLENNHLTEIFIDCKR